MPALCRYPARPGSVRVGLDQQQFITPRNKGRIMRRVRADYDPYSQAIAGYLLFDHPWQNGVCDPALATIAEKTKVGLSTVKDRLRKLTAGGVLRRINRGLAGLRRFVQWTNAYLFAVPDEPDCCEAVAQPPKNKQEIKRLREEGATPEERANVLRQLALLGLGVPR